jgi:hypothetical protein
MLRCCGGCQSSLLSCLTCEMAPDLQIVRDHSQPDPALEAIPAAVATAIQSVSSFQRADATFAAGPPTLALV